MKKKMLALVLAGTVLFVPRARAMNWLDFFATWLVASYAYHAWCNWMQYNNSNEYRPPEEVIRDLRECLKALRNKVAEEQRDIQSIQKDMALLREQMNKKREQKNKSKVA